jgi:beta-aspartyl-peptidase (threonine type)
MISLVVHGGAWDIPDDLAEPHKKGVANALRAGWEILKGGGSAVDAVERAVVLMEDDVTFNAGKGSFLNASGEVELDASIMDGRTFRAGAVAAVQNIRNPIRLARKIMEESEHVLLVGMGATRFARENGIKTCDPDFLITARELERWRKLQVDAKYTTKDSFRRKNLPSDTVGAVAMDGEGNIVAGTSTGGTPNKYPGRVGDSPLIGCGTYADNAVGGVSTTGWGEAIIKTVMAKTVIDLMELNGKDSAEAVEEGLRILQRKAAGFGGIIALNHTGRIAVTYNTPRMARAYMTAEMKTPFVAV